MTSSSGTSVDLHDNDNSSALVPPILDMSLSSPNLPLSNSNKKIVVAGLQEPTLTGDTSTFVIQPSSRLAVPRSDQPCTHEMITCSKARSYAIALLQQLLM